MKFSSLKADLQREQEGDWVEIPDLLGVSLKVRSLHTTAYGMARSLLTQKLARKYGRKAIPPEVISKEYGKLYAEHILLDWKGLDDDDGQPLPYDKEVAIEYLTNPAFRTLVAAVEWAAGQLAELDLDADEDDAKNSDAPSVTTSSAGPQTSS